jgi:predicted transcriptional regulator
LTHRYRPLASRQEATGSLLSDFLQRFFHGSAEQLILGLVDADQLAPDDLGAIEARLAKANRAGARAAQPEDTQPVMKPGRARKKS